MGGLFHPVRPIQFVWLAARLTFRILAGRTLPEDSAEDMAQIILKMARSRVGIIAAPAQRALQIVRTEWPVPGSDDTRLS
jgi:hypothetical protein